MGWHDKVDCHSSVRRCATPPTPPPWTLEAAACTPSTGRWVGIHPEGSRSPAPWRQSSGDEAGRGRWPSLPAWRYPVRLESGLVPAAGPPRTRPQRSSCCHRTEWSTSPPSLYLEEEEKTKRKRVQSGKLHLYCRLFSDVFVLSPCAVRVVHVGHLSPLLVVSAGSTAKSSAVHHYLIAINDKKSSKLCNGCFCDLKKKCFSIWIFEAFHLS